MDVGTSAMLPRLIFDSAALYACRSWAATLSLTLRIIAATSSGPVCFSGLPYTGDKMVAEVGWLSSKNLAPRELCRYTLWWQQERLVS